MSKITNLFLQQGTKMNKNICIILSLFLISIVCITAYEPLSAAVAVKSQGAGDYMISMGTNLIGQTDPTTAKIINFVLNTKAATINELREQFQSQVLDTNPDLEEAYNSIMTATSYLTQPIDAAKEAILRQALKENPNLEQIIDLWQQAQQIQTLMQENNAKGEVNLNEEGKIEDAELKFGSGEIEMDLFFEKEGIKLKKTKDLSLKIKNEKNTDEAYKNAILIVANEQSSIEFEGLRPPYENVAQNSYVIYDSQGNLLEAQIIAGEGGGSYQFLGKQYIIPEGGILTYTAGEIYVNTNNQEFTVNLYDDKGLLKNSYSIIPEGDLLITDSDSNYYIKGEFTLDNYGEKIIVESLEGNIPEIFIYEDGSYFISSTTKITFYQDGLDTSINFINTNEETLLEILPCIEPNVGTNYVSFCVDNTNIQISGYGSFSTSYNIVQNGQIVPVVSSMELNSKESGVVVNQDLENNEDIIVCSKGTEIVLNFESYKFNTKVSSPIENGLPQIKTDEEHYQELINEAELIWEKAFNEASLDRILTFASQHYILQNEDPNIEFDPDLIIIDDEMNELGNNIIIINDKETDYGQCVDFICNLPLHYNSEPTKALNDESWLQEPIIDGIIFDKKTLTQINSNEISPDFLSIDKIYAMQATTTNEILYFTDDGSLIGIKKNGIFKEYEEISKEQLLSELITRSNG